MKKIILTESDIHNIVKKTVKRILAEAARHYTANDFNCDSASPEMVQYVIDNVDDFSGRYSRALTMMDRRRCPLRYADERLYGEMCDAIEDWCADNGCDASEFSVEEIFG